MPATDSSNIYSQSKALFHVDRMREIRAGGHPAPVHLQIILADFCTHSCSWCSYRWDGNVSNELFHVIDPATGEKNHNPHRFLTYEKVIEVLDDCAEMGVKAAQFSGGGEPTTFVRHHDVFLETLKRGIEFSLVTHGALLKPPVIETLMQAAWVRVSIDAATPETYCSMRRVGKGQWKLATENLRKLCERRDALASQTIVGMGFVVSKENWREVRDAAAMAREFGVNSFRISAVFQPDNERYFEGFYDEARELCEAAESLSGGGFRVTNSFGKRLEDLRLGHPDYQHCRYQQFTTYLSAKMELYRCCNTSYSTRGLIGSIENQRFKDLWNSQALRDSFNSFDARSCERCQFNSANRAIEAGLVDIAIPSQSPPIHVNFV